MKEANFFCKAQPVVSGITVFNFDFMRFDLDFLGIYVIDIPITWMSILLSIKVEADIYGTNEKGRGVINMKWYNLLGFGARSLLYILVTV